MVSLGAAVLLVLYSWNTMEKTMTTKCTLPMIAPFINMPPSPDCNFLSGSSMCRAQLQQELEDSV